MINKKISTISGIAFLVIIASIIGGAILIGNDGSNTLGGPREMPPQPKSCTSEAKVCPDGSTVGRTGSNCDFAECPNFNEDPVVEKKEDIKYRKHISSRGYSFEVPLNSECIIESENAENCKYLIIYNFKNKSADDVLGDIIHGSSNIPIANIQIGGRNAYELVVPGYAGNYTIIVETDNETLELSFGSPTKDTLTDEENHIISTFSFQN